MCQTWALNSQKQKHIKLQLIYPNLLIVVQENDQIALDEKFLRSSHIYDVPGYISLMTFLLIHNFALWHKSNHLGQIVGLWSLLKPTDKITGNLIHRKDKYIRYLIWQVHGPIGNQHFLFQLYFLMRVTSKHK